MNAQPLDRPHRWRHSATMLRGALLMLMLLMGSAVGSANAAEVPRVYAVSIDGVISQLTADLVERVIASAREEQAVAVLLQIDSPGGGESAVRDIVRAVLGTSTPVIVYIGGDDEAQALSGALYIALAADVAAMGPESSVGIALPAGLSDPAVQKERDQRIERAIQIAAEASSRPRDPEMIAEVVRSNQMYTTDEALGLGLIDIEAADAPALLDLIDGREVQTVTDAVTLETDGARLVWKTATWRERVLQRITDPNVAYVLFTLGATLMIWELFNPSRFVAGLPGVVSLAVAVIAFGNMPISWLGLGFLILGALLMIRELYRPRLSALGPLGVIAYLAGSITLYRPVRQTSAIAPAVHVDLVVIIIVIALMVLALLLIKRSLFRVRKGDLPPDAEMLLGADGLVIEPLSPRGVVRVYGQEWSAISEDIDIDRGEHVRIESINAGVLHVAPEDFDSQTPRRGDGRLRESES